MKANSQLQRWFEDDDAMERALNAEYDVPFRKSCFNPFHVILTNSLKVRWL